MNFKRLSFEDILAEERLREYNKCHTPGGAGGGQFCSGGEGGGGGGGEPVTGFFKALRADRKKGSEPVTPFFKGLRADRKAELADAMMQTGRGGRVSSLEPKPYADGKKSSAISPTDRYRVSGPPAAAPVLKTPSFGKPGTAAPVAGPGAKKVSHKMERPPAGSPSSQHGVYRGMAIHTLGGYMTPYYYADAPGFGTFHHTPSLTRLKRQINTFRDTGVTAQGQEKAKASARYQKRKARGQT